MTSGYASAEGTVSASWTVPTATDNSGGPIVISGNFDPGDEFGVGEHTIVYTAVDESSNRETCTFTLIVQGKLFCYK